MLSLRNRFGIPGMISVIALVFAMMGGAYAAENSGDSATASAKKNRKGKQGGLNAKQKRQVRNISANIAKRFQGTGPIGPQGVPGLPGAPGSDGDDGSDGSDGSDGQDGEKGAKGDDGKSVLVDSFDGASEPPTEPCEGAGGSEFEVEDSLLTHYVCNGAAGDGGSGGLPGTVPQGETVTGHWASPLWQGTDDPESPPVGFMGDGESASALINFPLPLNDAPDAVIVPAPRDFSFAFGQNAGAGCPGVVDGMPTADEGKLCVYAIPQGFGTDAPSLQVHSPTIQFSAPPAASPLGAVISIECNTVTPDTAVCEASGLWAATSPAPAP